uniref:Uncharacterized protein n=1 Tax=Oryza brachyantha TaxID=4533 RepID=J3LKH0_ORYBR
MSMTKILITDWQTAPILMLKTASLSRYWYILIIPELDQSWGCFKYQAMRFYHCPI